MKKNKLYIIIILLGILLIFIPDILDIYNKNKYTQMERTWVNTFESNDYNLFWFYADKYNNNLLYKENVFDINDLELEYIFKYLNPFGTGQLGFIEIPKIDVVLPIYYGTDERVLQSGSGLLYGSSIPTGKLDTCSVITAHNGLIKSKMFTDLDKLKNGDTFLVKILNKSFECRIYDIVILDPDDLDSLRIVENKSLVYLYTCTPYGLNTHRLVVKGEINTIKEVEG